jgi:CheY-like chemotaxis protein
MALDLARVMPVLVVADADAELRDTVSGFMSARGYRVEPAADGDAASELLVARNVAVLISDLAMRGHGGVDLLSLARAAAPTTRTVAIAADLTPRERDAALRLGAVRVLAKPLALLELAEAIALAHDCAEGFHGWMHRMSLVDVLQMYHHAGQSLVLRITGDAEGAIWFHHGELIHAECRGQVGVAALIELLTAQHGRLESSALVLPTRTISGPFDHVLLDGLRALDEARSPERGAIAQSSLDGWFDQLTAGELHDQGDPADPLDRQALVRWLGEHAPGAGVWRVDPTAATLERLDVLGAQPEIEIAGTPGSLGWAYELAELADPTWTRVELTSGAIAIALIRMPGLVLAFARLVTGEAVQRRFQVESAQLVRWLHRPAGQKW